MAQSNAELMRGLYDSFAKGDVPSVLAALDPEVDWQESEAPGHPMGGRQRGPQAVLQNVFMNIGSKFDEFSVTPTEILEAGGKVIVLGQHHFKAKGNSTSYDAPFAHIVTFSNGKISQFQAFEDSALLIASVSQS